MNILVTFIKWVGGFFSDQNGNASRKAISLFFALWLLNKLVDKTEPKDSTFVYLFYGIVIIILFVLGAITSEFFLKLTEKNK
jgi:hypothetical protein